MIPSKSSSGSALLEIMTAMIVLIIGLTGLAPLLVIGNRVRRQALEQAEIQRLLVSQLEVVRGRVQHAPSCMAAMENGSQPAVLHGRDINLKWSVIPAEIENYSTDSLNLIIVTFSFIGSESIVDAVSSFQNCTPGP
jgi:Tfp pilus assembly protein PilV